MTDLSTRCERAGPDEQRELLIELWNCQPGASTREDRPIFDDLLYLGTDPAYLAAAVMLVPEGGRLRVLTQHNDLMRWYAIIMRPDYARFDGAAHAPALAICAAIARSLEL